jgi:ribosomal protein L11 methyltransferase
MKYLDVSFTVNAPYEGVSDAFDLIAAIAGEVGFESFDIQEDVLHGYIQKNVFDERALKAALESFPMPGVSVGYQVNEAEYKDWNSAWEENGFEPIIIDNKCVIHDALHQPTKKYEIDICIDAHLAFGTGTHATTQMIISEMADMDLSNKRVLDCGCGTGVLSLFAAKSHAAAVTAYDIDEWSTENTIHNAEINKVKDLCVGCGDVKILTNGSDVSKRAPFDVVLANINRNILLHDLPYIESVMSEHSTLILSGFYESDKEMLIDKATALGLTVHHQRNNGDWVMLCFRK